MAKLKEVKKVTILLTLSIALSYIHVEYNDYFGCVVSLILIVGMIYRCTYPISTYAQDHKLEEDVNSEGNDSINNNFNKG